MGGDLGGGSFLLLHFLSAQEVRSRALKEVGNDLGPWAVGIDAP